MDPRIVERDEMLLVGSPYFGDPSTGEFGQTWMRFDAQAKEIQTRVNPTYSYGLEFYTEEMEKSHRWYYMAAVEVPNLDVIPMGLVAKRLPAGLYAVHTVPAFLQKIGEGFGYIYGTWLPGSGYEVAHPYDFEFYEDGRFKGIDVEGSEIDLYVPIKRK
jgi:predicted transcriptional regulator YdeE